VLLRFITLSRWDQPAACGDLPTLPRSHRPALSLRTPPQLDDTGLPPVTQRSSARYRHWPASQPSARAASAARAPISAAFSAASASQSPLFPSRPGGEVAGSAARRRAGLADRLVHLDDLLHRRRPCTARSPGRARPGCGSARRAPRRRPASGHQGLEEPARARPFVPGDRGSAWRPQRSADRPAVAR
jgi:hypothetical protein